MDSIFKIGVMVTALDMLTGPFKKITQAVQGLKQTIDRAKSIIDFGGRIAASGALVGGAADKMKTYLFGLIEPMFALQDAEAPLATVIESTMGGAINSMKASRDAAIEWSEIHVQSADKVLQAQYIMAGAGLNDIQSIEGTKNALTLATGTMGDNMQAANLLAVVYNNMGNKTKDVKLEMGHLTDVLAKAQGLFQYDDLNTLNESLKYGIPSALQYRMSLEQLNVVLGQLNNVGLQGSQAGTAFAASMLQMNKASKSLGFAISKTKDGGVDFIGTLKNITGKYGDLSKQSGAVQQKFQDAFGAEGLRAIVLLQNKTGDMTDAMKAMGTASGTAAEQQRQMESTARSQWQISMNGLAAYRIELGNMLLPTILKGMNKVKEFVGWLTNFSKAHPQLVKTVVIVAAIGTAILSILAPIMLVIGGFTIMVGWCLPAFRLVGGAAKLFFNLIRFEGVTAMKMYWNSLKSVIASLGRFTIAIAKSASSGIMILIRSLPTLIASTWSWTVALLANPITWIVIGIIALIAAIVLLVMNWDKVTQAFSVGWSWIKNAWSIGIQFIGNLINQIMAFFAKFGIYILLVIAPFIGIPLLIISKWSTITSFFSTLFTNILGFVTGKIKEFKTSGAALIEAFVGGIKSVITKPYDVVKDGLGKLRKLLPFSDAKEGPLSSLTRSGRALVETLGQGVQQRLGYLKDTVSSVLQAASLSSALQMDLAVSGGGGLNESLSHSNNTPKISLREVFQKENKGYETNNVKSKTDVHLHYYGNIKAEKDDFWSEAQRRVTQNKD